MTSAASKLIAVAPPIVDQSRRVAADPIQHGATDRLKGTAKERIVSDPGPPASRRGRCRRDRTDGLNELGPRHAMRRIERTVDADLPLCADDHGLVSQPAA